MKKLRIGHPRTRSRTISFMPLAVALLAIVAARSARADYTYTYTGNPFSYVGTGPDVSNVSGYFDVSYQLAADTTYDLTPYTVGGVVNFDFTDGRTTWDMANFSATSTIAGGAPPGFSVTTDASGQIVSWYLQIYSANAAVTTCNGSACDTVFGYDSDDASGVFFNYDAYIFDSPGTWAEVPEPSTGLLFVAGLMGLGTIAARRGQISSRPSAPATESSVFNDANGDTRI